MSTATKTKAPPRLDAYVEDVLAGRIVVGRLVRLSVERHVADLAAAAERGLYFDADEARFAIDFIQCLKHSKGEWAGKPLILASWEAFIVSSLFGWRRVDGRRRFNTGYVEVARKNGKSTLGAAIGHKLFVADDEPGAEVYTAATKRDQAKIIHEEAKRMVRRSPSLARLVQIFRDNLSIVSTDSKYEPLGADADTLDGLNPSGAIIDEVHAHRTRDVWDVMETATAARRNPLLVGLTTAGAGNNRQSICWELRDYSIKVLEGTIEDDSWFAYIATLDEPVYDEEGQQVRPADDWTDEANWIKANPNLGVSVKLDDLRRKFRKARETPAAQANFKRKHLNIWVESLAAWLPPGLWDASEVPGWYDGAGLTAETIERYRGRDCWVGGDLASVDDLTALVFAFTAEDGGVDVLPFAWCPQRHARGRARDHRVPYLSWAQAGQLALTEGDSVDYDALRAQLRTARDEWGWNIREVALDPHNARYLVTRLAEEDGFNVIEHRQGFISMNDPVKQTYRLLLDRKLHHGDHRPLAWCISNIVTRSDPAGNIKFDKAKSADKIDLAVALVMAVGRLLQATDEAKSIYSARGLRWL